MMVSDPDVQMPFEMAARKVVAVVAAAAVVADAVAADAVAVAVAEPAKWSLNGPADEPM